jgi:uncharacterized protein YndB with AHSA1/START domain
MEKLEPTTVEVTINAPVKKVWQYFTEPAHIVKWNHASDNWHTTHSENDLKVGGSFVARMEAKDGSVGFDFGGIYTEVDPPRKIAYVIEGGRNVSVVFEKRQEGVTHVIETFDPEDENPIDMQRAGWQAILENFKKHAETL